MTRSRQNIALVGDVLTILLLIVALHSALADGFGPTSGRWRFSSHDPDRPLLLALVVTLLRHAIAPRPSLRDRIQGRMPTSWRLDPPVLPSAREIGWAALASVGITALMLHTQIASPRSVPDFGDPLLSMWRFAWLAHQLVADPRHLFDANIFHPAAGTLAFSDAALLPGLVALPFVAIGIPLPLVYTIVLITAFAASSLAMYVFAQATLHSRAGAALAAIVFAFWPYRFAHYGHLELQFACWMPLALLFAMRALATGSRRDGFWLGLCLALQLLSSVYYFAFLSVTLTVVAGTFWLITPLRFRGVLPALAVAAVVVSAVAVPLARPYLSGRASAGEREPDDVAHYSAHPRDYLTANKYSALYWPALDATVMAERRLFPGVIPVAIGAVGLLPPWSPVVAVFAVAAAASADASLGTNGASYMLLFRHAPGFKAFRVPARFAVLVGLFLAWFTGRGLARILSRFSRRSTQTAVAVVAFAAAWFELRPVLQLTPVWPTVPPIYASLPAGRPVALAEFPLEAPDPEVWPDLAYMYFSTTHWHRLVNGNSGFYPSWYQDLRAASRRFPDDASVAFVRDLGVEYVIFHERFYAPEAYVAVVERAQMRADMELVTTARWEGSETRLYRMRR